MVDNRTSGYYGIGGAFNFKSGDISGTAAKTADDRQSQGMDYFQQGQQDQQGQQEQKEPAVDRSAQLNATLNSLAMSNIATILHKNKRPSNLDSKVTEHFLQKEKETKVEAIKKDNNKDEDKKD